ncbi:hypothetical protein [Mycobacterium sp.]|uniref:hypothetical protein n=1 Tax=Mycobacterium sp. TaxID=1785 RepID=UPI003C707CD7
MRKVGVVHGVTTPSALRSAAFAPIGLAHSEVGSGELFTAASTLLNGPRFYGD